MRRDLPEGERRSNSVLKNGKNFAPGISENRLKLLVTNSLKNSFTWQYVSLQLIILSETRTHHPSLAAFRCMFLVITLMEEP